MPQTNAGDLKMVTEWASLRLHHPQSVYPARAGLRTAPSDLVRTARYVSIEPYEGG